MGAIYIHVYIFLLCIYNVITKVNIPSFINTHLDYIYPIKDNIIKVISKIRLIALAYIFT